MDDSFKTLCPTYDISQSWEKNVEDGPKFEGPFPSLPTEKRWKLLGFDLISPLGVASGPLPNADWILTYARLGFGCLTYKTVRSQAVPAHPQPNVVVLDVSKDDDLEALPFVKPAKVMPADDAMTITNSFGNPSPDPTVWMKEVETIKEALGDGQMLSVSVYGTNTENTTLEMLADDYALTANYAKKAGADAVELNLSCPNVVGLEDPNIYYSPNASELIINRVKDAVQDLPVIIKVGYYENDERLMRVLEKIVGVFQAVSAINTIPKKVLHEDGSVVLPGRETSGVCGAAIKRYGLETVARFVKARKALSADFEIIGVGGVMCPQDVIDYLDQGANHVQTATAAMWNPYLAYQLQHLLTD